MGIRKKLIVVIFSIFMILVVGVMGGMKSYLYKHSIQTNGEAGLKILRGIAETIDTELLMDIIEKQDMNNPDYLEMVDNFTRINYNNNLLYLYTVHYDENGVLRYGIVADGLDDTLGLALLPDDKTKEVLLTLSEGKDTYTQPYKREEWGTYISCNIPLKNNEGEIIGAIATDISEDYIEQRTSDELYNLATILIICAIIVLIVFWLVMEKIITNPINRIKDNLVVISQGDFTVDMEREVLAKKDEVGHIANMIDQTRKVVRDVVGKVKTENNKVKEAIQKTGNELKALEKDIDEIKHQNREQEVVNKVDLIHQAKKLTDSTQVQINEEIQAVNKEVKSLAKETIGATDVIKNQVKETSEALEVLTQNVKEIIDYIHTEVIDDCELLVSSKQEYEESTKVVNKLFKSFTETTENLSQSINKITTTIEDVSNMTQSVNKDVKNISQSIINVEERIDNISKEIDITQNHINNIYEVLKNIKV